MYSIVVTKKVSRHFVIKIVSRTTEAGDRNDYRNNVVDNIHPNVNKFENCVVVVGVCLLLIHLNKILWHFMATFILTII